MNLKFIIILLYILHTYIYIQNQWHFDKCVKNRFKVNILNSIMTTVYAQLRTTQRNYFCGAASSEIISHVMVTTKDNQMFVDVVHIYPEVLCFVLA